ncbi:hypothetical protein [Leptospira noguchii]|uniref:hypothetical protein n=1 Tax=Leptospira noguchii TaxID=28182 RepID=UPI0009E5560F|nr:hypothetical protein [Leptospira noguchii]UOG49699.1 hypothetical protein MAL00_05425 [Leptospira noguchii]
MNRILESKLNSANALLNSAKRFLRKRFRSFDRSRLKLNTTLSMNRVVGSKTHIFQVFRQE